MGHTGAGWDSVLVLDSTSYTPTFTDQTTDTKVESSMKIITNAGTPDEQQHTALFKIEVPKAVRQVSTNVEKVYGANSLGEEMITVDATANAGTIAKRGADGVLKVGSPSSNSDAVNLDYLETTLEGKVDVVGIIITNSMTLEYFSTATSGRWTICTYSGFQGYITGSVLKSSNIYYYEFESALNGYRWTGATTTGSTTLASILTIANANPNSFVTNSVVNSQVKGYNGQLTIYTTDWNNGQAVMEIAEAYEEDMITFYPATITDQTNATNAGLFVSGPDEDSDVTFTATTTPTVDITFKYFITRGQVV